MISTRNAGSGVLLVGLVAAQGIGCGPATPEVVSPPAPTATTSAVAAIPSATPTTTTTTTTTPPATPAPFACAPGAKCISTDQYGFPNPTGGSIAQCSGTYPDYVNTVSPGYSGTPFVMAQDYPKVKPKPEKMPWKGLDIHTKAGADAYMAAVRKYIYDGMLPANWVPQDNKLVKWVHVPWMTASAQAREFTHGLTQERPVTGPELSVKAGYTIQNYAIGFYNDVGAYTMGQVWANPRDPSPKLSQFAEGMVVVKILFTSATAEDWDLTKPSDWILDGAPAWVANVLPTTLPPPAIPAAGPGLRNVHLLQMDIAVRDDDAKATGWVFGTFAYDKSAHGANPWEKMVPVGLMSGNDPKAEPPPFQANCAAPTTTPLTESVISDLAPAYAKSHLGCQGRLNGPVDNPVSSCMSCHSTSQTPESASMIMPKTGCTPAQARVWFQNLKGSQAFGDQVDKKSCAVVASADLIPLDYSLQNTKAYSNFAATKKQDDPKSGELNNNPCIASGQWATDPNKALLKNPELHRLPDVR